MSAQADYQTFLLSEKDSNTVHSLLDKSYTYREPLSVGLHCTYEGLKPFFDGVVKTAIGSKASFGVRHTASGEVAGVLLNYIIDSPDTVIFPSGGYPTEMSNRYPKLMADFCEGIDVLRDAEATKQIELLLLTIHPEHNGKGLGKMLFKVSEEKGKELGCDIATVQATNFITGIILKKLNYEEVRKMDVTMFKKDDGTPLLDVKAMNGTTHFTYLIKRL